MHSLIDIDYSGPWTWGHLPVAAVALVLVWAAWRFGWPRVVVLMARPAVTLVALDNFSATYIAGHGPDKTRANFTAAGFERQTDVVSADMRSMPFPAASFDAVVSVTAIDHLDGAGITAALAEAARVIKPDGQFLLEVMHPDGWLRFAWGPLLMHGESARRIEAVWPARLREAGFELRETGVRPATFWMLAERKTPGHGG